LACGFILHGVHPEKGVITPLKAKELVGGGSYVLIPAHDVKTIFLYVFPDPFGPGREAFSPLGFYEGGGIYSG
jgi:hypothetical protein